MCNYSTYVLYHLSNLEKLDAIDVSSTQMRDLAQVWSLFNSTCQSNFFVIYIFVFSQATVVKKKMYYHMRVKTVRRNLINIQNKLNREKKILLQLPDERLNTLFFSLKSVRANCCFKWDKYFLIKTAYKHLMNIFVSMTVSVWIAADLELLKINVQLFIWEILQLSL